MLLSFAQFEREVTSERIRDKIAASKRKGLWVGGPLPLGYELKDGKLRVVEKEAERVRLVFRRYLEVTGINELVRDLQTKNDAIASTVLRIEVHRTQLIISLRPAGRSTEPATLSVSWQKPPSKRSRKILLPHGAARENTRPERAERRARFVNAIARGRRWLDEIMTGAIKDSGQLAKRERCTVRQINLTLSLAFLAPSLVRAAVEGRLPRGINIERLRDPDPLWTAQFRDLGLNSN